MNICRTLCPQAWLCGLADKSAEKEDVEVFDTGLENVHTLNDLYNGIELTQTRTSKPKNNTRRRKNQPIGNRR